MIVELIGTISHQSEYTIVLNVHGVGYEVFVPASVMQRLGNVVNDRGEIQLKIYHYLQMSPSSGQPILVGFLNDLERDFFLQFIKVSGIGPRAAVKALNKPISDITQAIDTGDAAFLKTLPGIGLQRAKEIVAKLQGKVGRFGLIQDRVLPSLSTVGNSDFQSEALDVLLQLQYKKPQALEMIEKTIERCPSLETAEELLNEIYKQKVA